MWSKVIGATLIGAIVFMIIWSHTLQRNQTARIRARLTVLTVWTIAILVWPVVWTSVVGEERSNPVAWPSLLWPILTLGTDISAMKQSTYEHAHMHSKRSMLSMDSNAICSLTFAISSIIGAKNHECCNRIFLYAVLGCIAFVMPTPYMQSNTLEMMTLEAVQKSILAYSTALLIGGVLIVVSKNGTVLIPN